jgi:hypothetical protein
LNFITQKGFAMRLTASRILASGCAALCIFWSAAAWAVPIVVAKHDNLLHQRNTTSGANFSPFFTADTGGNAFLPSDGWFPLDVTQAADPATATSTTPKKSFTIVGDSTSAGNWTDGNGIPAGITLTFDAEFTITPISSLPEDAGATLMLTVNGAPGTTQSGRGIGVTSALTGATAIDDINNGRGLAFSEVTVSNVNFGGALADPGFTFTPGGVSNFGVQLFESGQFQENNHGMTLTQGDNTVGFGQATGSVASGLRMDLGFGPYHIGTPPAPPDNSSPFPRQSLPFTISTTHGSATMFRGFTLGYDVSYDISAATAVEDADFDGDNDVDGADFLIWQRGVGTAGGQPQGNADGAGNIDGADLAIWKGQFASATAAAASVPEPASALMALAAAIGAAAIRHGRRRERP